MIKSELRNRLKEVRAGITGENALEKNAGIYKNVTDSKEFLSARVIMIYLSFKDEVETGDIIKRALELKKTVVVPHTEGDDMLPCVLEDSDNLKPGLFGIFEPKEIKPWKGEIDLAIVPGLGFSKAGSRIGFGRGYYDRFFKDHSCKKMGIAYSEQIMPEIYSDPWDIPMDMVVSEKEMFYCG